MFRTQGWMLVFNSLTALRFIIRDVCRSREKHEFAPVMIPQRGTERRLRTLAQKLADNFTLHSTHFRLALQGAAAAAAAMVVVKHLRLHYGYWVVMFSVLALKPNLGTALKSGKCRLLGTLIGVASGIVFVILVGVNNTFFIVALVVGAFASLYLMRLPYTLLSIGVTSFAIILLFSLLTHGDWELGLFRFLDIVIAVIIGIAISFLIWPNRAGRRLRHDLAAALEGEKELLRAILDGYVGSHGEACSTTELWLRVETALQESRSTYNAAMLEPGKNPALGEIIYFVIKHQASIFEVLISLESLAQEATGRDVVQELSPQLAAFGKEADSAFTTLSVSLTTAKTAKELPDLEGAHAAILKQVASIKASHFTVGELMNLAPFFWQLKTLAKELQTLLKAVNRLAAG